MRLGKQRHVDGTPARRGVVEARLVRQDRLACAGWPLHDVHAPDEQPAFEDAVEPLDSSGAAFRHWLLLAHLTSLRYGLDRFTGRVPRQQRGETGALTHDALDRHRATHGGTDGPHDPEPDTEAAAALLEAP